MDYVLAHVLLNLSPTAILENVKNVALTASHAWVILSVSLVTLDLTLSMEFVLPQMLLVLQANSNTIVSATTLALLVLALRMDSAKEFAQQEASPTTEDATRTVQQNTTLMKLVLNNAQLEQLFKELDVLPPTINVVQVNSLILLQIVVNNVNILAVNAL